ncbi:S8 family serine peptidase [Paenibacillus periandrae]|uniref:S8 family serine peptidase n=1 Tax=Paenibacillus periandrae TaxID=1761741 RepID=UPI001F08F961|nr:S8 family serine peptidase [Paenibacillus periandrae]
MLHSTLIRVVILSLFMACLSPVFGLHDALGEDKPVQIMATTNDPLVEKQTYLRQIHINEAWDTATSNESILIAIVDTGVDLNHPDLSSNLVKGINLINPNQPPRDDNGHGTNVAGVIGAVANNDQGISGILWKTQMMPIKALERDGTGSEAMLGEGIRYAVDHGAQIVVLSLGLNKYSTFMRDIVQYAEDHNVLLVAAAGNEGNNVKYPAAYPTVLAVGGMSSDKKAHKLSNKGPEIDVVAPWDVFTTGLGDSYEYKDGTSMAAAQVAAVCALAWNKYPWMKPYQIRSLVRQTAEDIDGKGWNPATGYGLLRADRIVEQPYQDDMYKPNNSQTRAKAISVSTMVNASFVDGKDQSWFVFEAPYDGTVKLELGMEGGNVVAVSHTDTPGTKRYYDLSPGGTVQMPVKKGKSYLQLQLKDRTLQRKLSYLLTTSFEIYKDPYADNDRQYKAYVLPAGTQTLTGTFHKKNDQDWFVLPVTQTGKLSMKLSTDTARMDPVLFVQKKGEKGMIIDRNGEGETEYFPSTEVFPGDYYIRVSNADGYPTSITGEYTLFIEFNPKLLDPNKPNHKPYLATHMHQNTPYQGLIESTLDADWFSIKIEQESIVELHLTGIPDYVQMSVTAYNGKLKQVDSAANRIGSTEMMRSQRWQPGFYYIQLNANIAFDHQMYGLEAVVKPL